MATFMKERKMKQTDSHTILDSNHASVKSDSTSQSHESTGKKKERGRENDKE